MPTAETIATRLARQLAHRGVRHAFGMPGGSTVPLLAAFEAAGIDFCLVRHEGAAGFMADAAYQLTGAPGVCVSTLGPGATNLVTGAAGALMERSRMLAIAGQCDPAIEALYTHQILDQVALFRPVTRHAEALRAETAARQLDLIFRRLDHGPPGPIYLELAASVARTETSLPPWPVTPAPPVRPADAALDAAVIRLQQAQRPVLFVGCGDLRSETAAAVTALADALNAPVMTSYRAKGMIDEASPWSVGAAGLSPKVDAIQQALLRGADLLIAVGLDPVELRPNWLPGWPETLPVINIDPYGQPDLIAHSEVELRGDPNLILSAMLADVSSSAWTVEALDAHRAGIHALFEDGPDGPAAAIRAVQRGLDGAEAVVSLDVGAHRITASHVWQSRQPGRLLQSNGFSSMGSGLPMAIAARLCRPALPAIALTGDMGLWMVTGELGTAAERGLDLTVVYLADDALSLIALKQERGEKTGGGVGFTNPDPALLARAYGGRGVRVSGEDAIEAAVRDALQTRGLNLIEARIDPKPYRQQM